MDQNKKNHIEFQYELIKNCGITKLYGCPAIFCIIGVIICGIMQLYTPLLFLVAINIAVFFLIVVTIWRRHPKKMVILCGALIFTDISIVFCILSFLILSTLNVVSIWYIIFGIAFYLVLSILNILSTFKKIKNSINNNHEVYKKPSTIWGVLGGTIGMLIARGMFNTMEYESAVWGLAMISLFVSLFCSVGAQLYLSYYWLKKDENNNMNNT